MCHLVVRVITTRIESPDFSGLSLQGRRVGGMEGDRDRDYFSLCFVKEKRLLGVKKTPRRAKKVGDSMAEI